MNCNERWYAAAETSGTTVSADTLKHELQLCCGFDRRTMELLLRNLRMVLLHELAAGNAVEVFGLLKLRPDLQLRQKVSGTEADVARAIGGLTERDVRPTLAASVNRSFAREYARKCRLGL